MSFPRFTRFLVRRLDSASAACRRFGWPEVSLLFIAGTRIGGVFVSQIPDGVMPSGPLDAPLVASNPEGWQSVHRSILNLDH